MNISKKEARETFYWLRLLIEVNADKKAEIEQLMQENKELLSILTSIVKSSSIS